MPDYLIIFIVFPSILIGFEIKLNGFNEIKKSEDNNIENGDIDVEKKEQEVLPVPEAHTIVDPRTVMVHIKHASVTCGTVMASLRFENIAHQTVPSSFVL